MKAYDDFLVEIHTGELPPKSLLKLAEAFCQQITERLQKCQLPFSDALFFATPRRLAVFIKELAAMQPEQIIERKGPARSAAFDAAGRPTLACIGFARSCGVAPEKLITLQGEWMGYKQVVPGKSVMELIPEIISQALSLLPFSKRMRWDASEVEFERPVHSIILLYGDQVIEATLLNCRANRRTRGHRFHAPDWINIPDALAYSSLLETAGYVVADFSKRRDSIRRQAIQLIKTTLGNHANVFITDELLDEVTGLVEWPVALCGQFDVAFLDLPKEVLISSMQDHQRYFPVIEMNGNLLPHFITISNIQSQDPDRVIHGNECVLRARLSDAAFFYSADKKENLMARVEQLKGIVFQEKLGTLYEKVTRMSQLAVWVANKIHINTDYSARAALLSKADLTTQMVGEFPELQGVMGYYYAKYHGEVAEVAEALKEQYMPRFSGDVLPESIFGQVLSLVDRVDTLIGAFGIQQIPTGDKDPYGLRRLAVGVLRILIEKKMAIDLKELFVFAVSCYGEKLNNPETISQLFIFMQERLRAWYQEQGVTADVFAAVAALAISNPLDMHARIQAVQAFKKLNAAQTLSAANKRVSNILAKDGKTIKINKMINPALFEHPAEKVLAHELEIKKKLTKQLFEAKQYDELLLQLAELREPIDHFFNEVMVMTEDQARRENRLLLLSELRALFLQVADIALLQ